MSESVEAQSGDAYCFSEKERQFIRTLAEKVTGHLFGQSHLVDALGQGVGRLLSSKGYSSLGSFLRAAVADESLFDSLISSLAIHTTNWFREKPHFDILEKSLTASGSTYKIRPFRLLSAGCSTGEEVYSFGLVLEQIRKRNPDFDYRIEGWDIDPISVRHATQGVYSAGGMREIPLKYRTDLRLGSGASRELMTLTRDIRKRCNFSAKNLLSPPAQDQIGFFDFVVCRNVLIYFGAKQVSEIVESLIGYLRNDGLLCLGHSDVIDVESLKLQRKGNNTYTKKRSPVPLESLRLPESSEISESRKRVLVVDDSATMRKLISSTLAADFDVDTADSAQSADTMIHEQSYDLITLDLHMPVMTGAEWLRSIRDKGNRTPVIIVSGASPNDAGQVLGALEQGAQDYLEKKAFHKNKTIALDKVKAIVACSHKASEHSYDIITAESTPDLKQYMNPDMILVGASTGGPEALTTLLADLSADCPPILLVQHISANFAEAFCNRMAQVSKLKLGRTTIGEPIRKGHIYIATGDYHLTVGRSVSPISIVPNNDKLIHGHRPSVDVLFASAAKSPARSIGILLTGMGKDGVAGIGKMKNSGSLTIAQDPKTCVVAGMPGSALQAGHVDFAADLVQIRRCIDIVIDAKNNGAANVA